jgi:formate hydrogenlyase subunit 3/multisubunit Na+/H+ antiporter MnhD subunit
MTEEFAQEKPNNLEENQYTDLPQKDDQSKKYLIISIIVIIIILAFVVLATIFLLKAPEETTAKVRDVFIIFMALESLVIGVALVVLIIQLSTLINLLQNEIRPIINSTNETVNTLKGTAKFISDHLTEPVIKINQYLAMAKKLVNPSNRKSR